MWRLRERVELGRLVNWLRRDRVGHPHSWHVPSRANVVVTDWRVHLLPFSVRSDSVIGVLAEHRLHQLLLVGHVGLDSCLVLQVDAHFALLNSTARDKFPALNIFFRCVLDRHRHQLVNRAGLNFLCGKTAIRCRISKPGG